MRPTTALVLVISGLNAGTPAADAAEPQATKLRLERPTAMTKADPGERPATVDGQRYRGLDDYLAKLERDGFVGKAWYRQVKPGLYELVTSLKPPPAKRLFTRAELARKFGFVR